MSEFSEGNRPRPAGRHRGDDDYEYYDSIDEEVAGATAAGGGEAAGVPLRGLAMVLIFIGVILAAWGVYHLMSRDQGDALDQAASSTAATAPAEADQGGGPAGGDAGRPGAPGEPAPGEPAPGEPAPAAPAPVDRARVHVQVLNNGMVAGRAEQTAGELGGQGWGNVGHGNLSDAEYRVQADTVFFTPGNAAEEAAARELAESRGPGWVVAERPAELAGQPAGLLVVLT
ncbi:LytR C-terminal domain-containing protein [Corynebacterium sphenisci]|uniref:LytR C-terminal domain-containing protein n=1 Tax=Corynebacterium sphenisci TaxID=191493 RepID=UPI0009528BDC|nr:LytR C-terminal domain-containing protein [Corynebacterium sphenisci]